MAVMAGALPSVIKKLGELLIGEYNLQKGVKGDIRFLQSELESMQGALEKVSNTPIDQLDIQDKNWARNLRELSYDIEDSIDTFMVRGKCNEQANLHGIKKFIDTSVGLFRKTKIPHGIATEITDFKSRVEEVAKRWELSLRRQGEGGNRDKSMEIVTGAIPSLLHKLGELLVGEYNLQKEVKGGIIFLQAELESMQGALQKISRIPADEIDEQDKIWASNVREMSYDIEDNIDKYIVQCKGRKTTEQYSFKEAIDRTLKWFRQPKIRRKIATEIREIKSRVIEVHERRRRYEVSLGVDKPVTVDPRLFATEVKELVGIDEARDELISKIMIQENEVPKKQGKIVSIVGFGGLGKTALANAVYEKIRAQFDCCAFVSASQTPDLTKLYKGLLYDLGKSINDETLDERRLIDVLRQFLQNKRYFIVVDDVWHISVWEMIRCALPDNDVGYTIITTTRISRVAEQAGGAYNMKPLSFNNSRKLLYRRIFGNGNKDNNEEEEKCHEELAEVSDKILKKCAGVPLVIITMANLLACKAGNKMEGYEVYNSLGISPEYNPDVKNIRKILSGSYYDLPCHLKDCLLYLSMFPHDYEIEKDRLIRMWIGEGFIQCEKAGKSLFELGESYFDELIRRSLIEPVYAHADIMIEGCRVHDMMLDLIRSLSSEANFVTVLSNMGGTSPSNTIRRLSLQNDQESHVMAQATWSLQHARSVLAFPASISLVPPLDCCRVLRVLDLEDCNLSQANSILRCLGNIHHLRYLGLRRTGISQLPEEIGNLQFLQTLDVRRNKISTLPSSVVQLRNLMFLRSDMDTRVPNGIASLTSLEELSQIGIYDSTGIEIIYCLTELRVLDISCHIECMDSLEKSLVECLCKLQKIQNLDIIVTSGECKLDGLVLSQKLRRLSLRGCWFSTLPAWVNPSFLVDLSFISIAVIELKEEDLEILGRFPALCYLNLKVDSLEKSLVECQRKLQNIQNLNIIVTSDECKLDGLVLSQKLRRLSLRGCWFSTLPAWVNPSLLVDLSFISIAVIELKEEDLEILGRLPALCYLNLKVDHENLGIIRRFIIGAFFFPCLEGCVLWGFRGPVVFHQGAMPKLTSLRFTLHARDTREISGSSDGGYDFGFQNLPSLQDVTVLFRCGGTSDKEVKEVMAALRHATTIHPNHPTIDIVGYEDKDE